jgi:hypothetical protein
MTFWQSCCAALTALGALLACSSEDGGPRSTTVGAELEDSSLGVCVRLPVLLGSQTAASTSVGSAFDMDVRALRHNVHISFPGAQNSESAARSLSLSQLLNGYSEVVTVTGRDGVNYDVILRSGCRESSANDP